jgi:hypothetical protein
MMHRSNVHDVPSFKKVSKVLSKVLVIRRQQERGFTEKPIKNKGNSTTGGISHHKSTKSSNGG